MLLVGWGDRLIGGPSFGGSHDILSVAGWIDRTIRKPVDYYAQVFRGPQEVYLEAKDGHRGLTFAPDSTNWERRADKTLEQSSLVGMADKTAAATR